MRVDRFHHVADVASGLLDVDDAVVFETGALSEREEIVVEGYEKSVVFDGM